MLRNLFLSLNFVNEGWLFSKTNYPKSRIYGIKKRKLERPHVLAQGLPLITVVVLYMNFFLLIPCDPRALP
jgi:hypothetical protein